MTSGSGKREAFEKWLENKPELRYGNQPPQRHGERYSYGPTDIAWMGWQAALAQAGAAHAGVKTRSHQEWLLEKLASGDRRAGYLKAAKEDSPEAYIAALEDCLQALESGTHAQGGEAESDWWDTTITNRGTIIADAIADDDSTPPQEPTK